MIKFIIQTVMGIVKGLMVLGAIEFVAPGLSYEISKYVAELVVSFI